MEYVVVGDPHVTPDTLEECSRLMQDVFERLTDTKDKKKLVLLGDLFHTHASIRVEVMHFWSYWLKLLGDELGKENVIVLVGNHDMPGNPSAPKTMHALIPYKQLVTIVESPQIIDGIAYMPYYHDPKEFVEAANAMAPGTDFLICHQTFSGARYENSYPAKDGVDPDDVNIKFIVSGHIHMPQDLGKKLGDEVVSSMVSYVGAPRWMTASDANQDRGYQVFEVADGGLYMHFIEKVSTEAVCGSIKAFELTPMNWDNLTALLAETRNCKKVYLTIKGQKQWVKEMVQLIPEATKDLAANIIVKSAYSAENTVKVRESEGLANSLRKYIYGNKWDISQEELWDQVTSRVPWLKTQ
ncbi:MAG: metallophosphoesterase [Candidatus Ranarchaeia archaeon]